MNHKQKLIYVVDDLPNLCVLLEHKISMMGLSVRTFTNPLLAYESCKEQAPDVLITDVVMPEILGTELLMMLRSEGFNIPAIVISGYMSFEAMNDLKSKGLAKCVLGKPIDFPELKRALNKILCVEEVL